MELSDPLQSLIEYLSPNELLAALNTLQKIKEEQIREFELRYSQRNHEISDEFEKDHDIDLDLYEALEIHESSNKQKVERGTKKKTMRINTEFENLGSGRKQSLTPNCRNTFESINRLSESKSLRKKKLSEINEFEVKGKEGHSPSLIKNTTFKPKQNFSSKYGLNNTCQLNRVEEKQVPILKPRAHETSTKLVQISTNSKKIMLEKQKKGQTYIPIQNRTSLLIKEKQEKIAKIQKTNEDKKELENRECTFKPQINSYRKAVNKEPLTKRSSNRLNTDSEISKLELSEIGINKIYEQDESMENYFGTLTERRDGNRSVFLAKSDYQNLKNERLRNQKENNFFGAAYG